MTAHEGCGPLDRQGGDQAQTGKGVENGERQNDAEHGVTVDKNAPAYLKIDFVEPDRQSAWVQMDAKKSKWTYWLGCWRSE